MPALLPGRSVFAAGDAPEGSHALAGFKRICTQTDLTPRRGERNMEEERETIRGTIKWDDGLQGELPEIVTGTRSYTWIELGQELMAYEGWRIEIVIG